MQNQISMIGLDRAGKTVIFNYLATGIVSTDYRPTLAINYSRIVVDQIKYAILDIPGQQRLRNLWIQKCEQVKCVIFVLDTADAVRFPEADQELTKFLKEYEGCNYIFLFLFHKMDLPHAKQHIDEAKIYFNADIFKSRGCKNVKFIETSIADPTSLDAIKTELVKHIGEACID